MRWRLGLRRECVEAGRGLVFAAAVPSISYPLPCRTLLTQIQGDALDWFSHLWLPGKNDLVYIPHRMQWKKEVYHFRL